MDKSGGSYPDPEIYYQGQRQDALRRDLEDRVANLELAMRQLVEILEANGIEVS